MKTSFYYFTICACAATLILVPVNLTVSMACSGRQIPCQWLIEHINDLSGTARPMTTFLTALMELIPTIALQSILHILISTRKVTTRTSETGPVPIQP